MAKPPAKRTPRGMLADIPSIDAALYQSVGRYAGAAVMTAFEQIGGTQRLAEWAEANPTDFYKGVFTKLIAAPKQVEVSGTVNFRQALEALNLEPGTGYTEVEDAVIEEDEDEE